MKRFRFSLLSLVVAVVLVGGVGWLNVRSVNASIQESMELGPVPQGGFESADYLRYGWPFAARLEISVAEFDAPGVSYVGLRIWHWRGLVANIAVGFTIVLGGAATCEYVVRRRERKSDA